MSEIINFVINDANISESVIVLLLGLPFLSVIIGIARYYIGIKTFSLYTPIILTVSYYLIQINFVGDHNTKVMAGVLYGVLITILLIISTLLSSQLYKHTRLHYFPKISLIFSSVVILMFVIMVALQYTQLVNFRDIDLSAFILITIVFEKFVNVYSKKKFRAAIILSIETILLSLVCYTFISLPQIKTLLLTYPWIIILTLPTNYIIGKYKGLRLTEYFRFQNLLNKNDIDSTNGNN